jgi:hypothetical protein
MGGREEVGQLAEHGQSMEIADDFLSSAPRGVNEDSTSGSTEKELPGSEILAESSRARKVSHGTS